MYQHNNLAKGNVVKKLISFSIPFIISNLVQTLYSVADMLIVGRFDGTASMSGVNIGGQITNLMMIAAIGLTAGATVLIAQSVGGEKTKQLHHIISTLFTSLIIIAVVMTLLVMTFHKTILDLIQTPGESYSEAVNYLMVTASGTIFIFGYNALSAIMRGMGDSKTPLYLVSIACAINVVLDLLFVAVFGWGAGGAGIATVISQAISMILCIVYLKKRKFVFDFNLKSFKIHKESLRAIFRIGIPITIQNLIANVSFLFLTSLVNPLGVTASAAVGVVGKYNGFAILPAIAMNAAISAMSAQNLGADSEERAKKTCYTGMAISFSISLVIFLITIIWPGEILSLFADEPAMIAVGIPYLIAFSIDYLLVPFAFSLNGLFVGAGHTTYTLINNIVSGLLLRIPMAYLLSTVFNLGLLGVGLSVPIATFGASMMNLWFFFSGRWKRKMIHIEEDSLEKAIGE